MEMEELLAQVDFLLHIASSKCDTWEEAQDLVQNTLLEGLLAIKKGTKIENAKNWLSTVLNRKYYDLLREKYRKPLIFSGIDSDIIMDEESYQPKMENTYELTEEENLRRLVARMTKLYREVLVRHYFRGQGIKEIAEELSLQENTIKSRLRLGREKLRKELTMEKYEKPVTIPELADAIGISTTYIEPIVERLVDGELMKQTGDKVYTNFIIYTEKDVPGILRYLNTCCFFPSALIYEV